MKMMQNLARQSIGTSTPTLSPTGEIDIDLLSPHEPGYNVQTVPQLQNIIQNGGTLDPIQITEYGGKIYTVDGANRVTATMLSGQTSVPYNFIPFEQLNSVQQMTVRGISETQMIPIVNFGVPTTYDQFPAFYDYNSGSIR